MGVVTVTAFTDTRREAIELEKDVGGLLAKAGAAVKAVKVTALTESGSNYKAQVQFLGDMTAIVEDLTLEDLACSIWDTLGDYCWLHIFVSDGKDELQEKFSKADYRDLMGE